MPVLQNYSATEFAGAGAGWTLADYREHYPAKRGSAVAAAEEVFAAMHTGASRAE